MQIFYLQEVPVRVLKRTRSVPERLEAGQLAARDGVWKNRPVADLASKSLFNHLCDLNLRTET